MSGAQGPACRFLVLLNPFGLTLDMHALRKGGNDSVCNPGAELVWLLFDATAYFSQFKRIKI